MSSTYPAHIFRVASTQTHYIIALTAIITFGWLGARSVAMEQSYRLGEDAYQQGNCQEALAHLDRAIAMGFPFPGSNTVARSKALRQECHGS